MECAECCQSWEIGAASTLSREKSSVSSDNMLHCRKILLMYPAITEN